MTPTAQEAARQLAHNFFKDNPIMKRACGTLWKNYRGNLKTLIANALITFAQSSERAVWEEAEKLTETQKEPPTSRANAWSCRLYWLAGEFHRRATTVGKE